MVWNPNDARQKDYKDKWRPTDAEKINSYNSIISNSGIYEIKNDTLICFPNSAKTPSFIGGRSIYKFLLDGHNLTLILTEVYSHDDVKDLGVDKYKTTLKLKKVE